MSLDRLRQVSTAAGLRPAGQPRRVTSHSNDTWAFDDDRLGPVVLRVSWRGDVSRLGREVAVAREVPIRYPEVLAHGEVDGLAYSVTRYIRGQALSELEPGQLREAIRQLAQALRVLHSWRPSAELTSVLLARRADPDRITGLLGADLNPLPLPRVLELVEHAATLPHTDPGLLREAASALTELAPAGRPLDDPGQAILHGDLQLGNLLWDGELVVLDLEWARFGPPLLDLQRLCAQADADVLAGHDTHPAVLRWLAEDYPEAFQAAPGELRLYGLAYAVRDLLVNPPGPSNLRRLVDGTWPAPGALPPGLHDLPAPRGVVR
ncbi:aminoglycoside phosphotransferase (APT) family kinase protein [Crossiella equi]|uniref:Aminoglycoside phosphotransferase (APT) family kinase protein n=1 Tax=Crossiella equi TaxID=130796 RepID=A0ABS5A870_9PSEU|nr:phosphotransferase [Crossiella equi]MBP2472467.1 aminoglycoside phosphotransferase (APT) family kinase protein [Crossiella equi]